MKKKIKYITLFLLSDTNNKIRIIYNGGKMITWQNFKEQILLGFFLSNQIALLIFAIIGLIYVGFMAVPLVIISLIVNILSMEYIRTYLRQKWTNQ